MLLQPTLEKLRNMKFSGMGSVTLARALEEQLNSSDFDTFSFTERLGLLVDREHGERENRRLTSRLKVAKLETTGMSGRYRLSGA